jgi:ribose/xylose/arabinose/galactoside ABC-type transport system permease subunit
MVLCLIAGVFTWFAPQFMTAGNLATILRHLAADGFAALGLTFVIVVARYEVSFPGVVCFVAMAMGFLISGGLSLPLAFIGGVLICAGVGAINGIAVSYLKLNDMVSTIAVGSLAGGGAFLFNGGQSFFKNFVSCGLLRLNDAKFAGINISVYLLIGVYFVAWLILHRSRFGRVFYATGENPTSATYSGINVRAVTFWAYLICSVLMALVALMLMAETGMANVHIGSGCMMAAYTGVFLGAALFGGAGVPATFAGTLLIAVILNGFNLLSVPYYWSDAVLGVVLVLGIVAFHKDGVNRLKNVFKAKKKAQDRAVEISDSDNNLRLERVK